MKYQLSITHEEKFIHAKVEGNPSFKGYLELWSKIAQACEKFKCYNVLGESFAKEVNKLLNVQNSGEIFREAGITTEHKIAWISHNPANFDRAKMSKNILTETCGYNVELFDNVESAKAWLTNISDDNAQESK